MTTPEAKPVSDRELLELAANVHGYIDDASDPRREHGLHLGSDGLFYVSSKDGWWHWNPLQDDGDALRLAVKLRLDLVNGGCAERFNSDPYAATRRAIVRAAAELGRAAITKD